MVTGQAVSDGCTAILKIFLNSWFAEEEQLVS